MRSDSEENQKEGLGAELGAGMELDLGLGSGPGLEPGLELESGTPAPSKRKEQNRAAYVYPVPPALHMSYVHPCLFCLGWLWFQ